MTEQIAKQVREVYFGGDRASPNLKDILEGLSWQQATTRVDSFNTIAALVYHMNYFVSAVLKVLQGEPLIASDKLSFDHPPILSQKDWENLLAKARADAENFAILIEQLPEATLWADFSDKKYGSYYKNIHGIVEHNRYHLGQIILLNKLVSQANEN